MSGKDKVDLIYDIVRSNQEENKDFRQEVKDAYERTEDKLSKIQEDFSKRLNKIEKLDETQNNQLAEHMRRSDLLEILHKDNESRIRTLEQPLEVISALKRWLILGGKVAGAVVAISAVLKLMGLL